ncbi:MAG: RIP metalloprotease RseP [Bacteroidetes bacterium]|nr:RIP metalloprotease RseP [Bacteroidota bacterium]
MGTITMIGQVLLALSILIIFHEWGHFQTARWFGIKVEKFFLFFDAWGKKLFSFKKGDTEYGVGWLPLGGYVKISGMIDESMDKEFLDKEPEEYEFRSKPVWQRLIVMLGGVTVNIILGIIIYGMVVFVWGESFLPMEKVQNGIAVNEIGKEIGLQDGDKVLLVNGQKPEKFDDLTAVDVLLSDGSYVVERNGSQVEVPIPGDMATRIKKSDGPFIFPRIENKIDTVIAGKGLEKAGFKKGDLILTVNGEDMRYFHDIQKYLQDQKGKTIELGYQRNGNQLTAQVEVNESGEIGFGPVLPEYEDEFDSFGTSFAKGTSNAFSFLFANIKAFGKVFSGEINASESVAGPIGIARIFGSTWDWHKFWSLTGALSMILAFFNVLPIPALDGGHVFFLLIEWVRGKPLSDKALERAQIVGFVILLALMVLIFGNDIYRAIIE